MSRYRIRISAKVGALMGYWFGSGIDAKEYSVSVECPLCLKEHIEEYSSESGSSFCDDIVCGVCEQKFHLDIDEYQTPNTYKVNE